MKQITLLIDVMIGDTTIEALQEMVDEQPLVDLEIRKAAPPNFSFVGRFIGAQEPRGHGEHGDE